MTAASPEAAGMRASWQKLTGSLEDAAGGSGRSLQTVVWGSMIAATAALLGIVLVQRELLGRAGMAILVVNGTGLVALACDRRGWRAAARWIFMLGLLGLVTGNAWLAGGMHSPGMSLYMVLPAMAGLLLGTTGALLTAALCVALGAGLVAAELAGLLAPPAFHYNSFTLLLLMTLYIVLILVITRLSASSIARSLRRAREELRERGVAEQRLQLALDAGAIGLWDLDVATGVTRADNRAFAIFGMPVTPDHLVSWEEWRERIHPQDLPEVEKLVSSLAAAGGQVSVEYRLAGAGTATHVHVDATSFPSPDGSVHVVGMIRDVSEHVASQTALRESEEKFRAVFMNSPDAMFLATVADGRVVDVNDGFEAMIGYAAAEVIGRTVAELDVYAEPEARPTILALLSETGRVTNHEIVARRRNGDLFIAAISMMVLRLGEEPHIVGIVKDVTEAWTAAEALKDGEERYRRLEAVLRALFDSTDDFIWAVDATEFRIIEINRTMVDYFRTYRGLESALGYDAAALFGSDSGFANTWTEWFRRALREGPFVVEDYEVSTGSMTLELHFGLLRRDGEVFGISVFGRNITKRRLAQAELARSERRFRGIFDESPLGIGASRDGIVLFGNPAVARMLGLADPAEMTGRPLTDFLTPASARLMIERQKARQLGADLPSGYEIEAVRADGTTFFVYMYVSGWELPDGPATLAFFEDLTEKRRAEEVRAHLETRFRTFFQASPFGIGVSRAGRTVLVNPAYAQMFGFATPEELEGTPLADCLAPECREEVVERSRKRLAGEEVESDFRLTGLRGDGTRFPLRARVILVELPDGPAGLAFFEDLTEKERAEQERAHTEAQLRHAQQMEAIGTLAAGFAHDFNNVLAPVLGGAGLALEALPAESPLREEIGSIEAAARRAQDLVRQILLLSRSEKEDAAQAPVDLLHVVKETIRLVRAGLPATIQIRSQLPPSCPTVLGNATGLHQVLLNLCTNARDAMGSVGTLTIGLRELAREEAFPSPPTPGKKASSRWVELSVSDTGSGMPPEVQRRIFEPYFTTKPRGKGTGLGLSVTHGIITSMGGQIRVRSAPGAGTTFEVLLPASGRADAVARARKLVPRGKGERILVIDDEVAVRGVMVRILRSLGYTAAEVEEPEAVLALIGAAPGSVDAIVMDQTMPGMTGVELARACLALRPDLPIVLCTGDAAIAESAREGVRGVLPKPFTIEAVAEALHAALADGRRSADDSP